MISQANQPQLAPTFSSTETDKQTHKHKHILIRIYTFLKKEHILKNLQMFMFSNSNHIQTDKHTQASISTRTHS